MFTSLTTTANGSTAAWGALTTAHFLAWSSRSPSRRAPSRAAAPSSGLASRVTPRVAQVLGQMGVGAWLFVNCFTSRGRVAAALQAAYSGSLGATAFTVVIGAFVLCLAGVVYAVMELLLFHLYILRRGISTYDYILMEREAKARARAARSAGSGGAAGAAGEAAASGGRTASVPGRPCRAASRPGAPGAAPSPLPGPEHGGGVGSKPWGKRNPLRLGSAVPDTGSAGSLALAMRGPPVGMAQSRPGSLDRQFEPSCACDSDAAGTRPAAQYAAGAGGGKGFQAAADEASGEALAGEPRRGATLHALLADTPGGGIQGRGEDDNWGKLQPAQPQGRGDPLSAVPPNFLPSPSGSRGSVDGDADEGGVPTLREGAPPRKLALPH